MDRHSILSHTLLICSIETSGEYRYENGRKQVYTNNPERETWNNKWMNSINVEKLVKIQAI